jgi:uncharacterized protein (DUF362 family)
VDTISRRRFLEGAAATAAVLGTPLSAWPAPEKGKVVVAREADRGKAVAACFEALEFRACDDRDVTLKANFNSDDAFPASTHPETLAALFARLQARKATSITLAERSGMGETRRVLERTGAVDVAKRAGVRVVVLDEVGRPAWEAFRGEHWPNGLHAARLFTEAPCAVQTMCCKTHRFGGHVTLSLKNSVGMIAKHVPGDAHNYMQDLHRSPDQRAMIAEANLTWRPALNIMDALEAFVDGGPEAGTRAAPGVFLASDDRCALDAAAIALLRLHGMKGPAGSGPIARTDQLARALALGLGAAPQTVEVVPASPAAADVAKRLTAALAQG